MSGFLGIDRPASYEVESRVPSRPDYLRMYRRPPVAGEAIVGRG
jgi:hypothetical protein